MLLSYLVVRDFRAEVGRGLDGGDELLLCIATIAGASADVEEMFGRFVREKTMVRPRVVVDLGIPDGVGLYKIRRWDDCCKADPRTAPEREVA